TNIYDTSRNRRMFGGNVIGAWSSYTFNGTFDHNEYFSDSQHSSVVGNWPRLSLTRNDRPLLGTWLYLSASGELASLIREDRRDGKTTRDSGVTRLDVSPQIRVPFTRIQFLTVNSTIAWRDTFYTRSLDPAN